MPIDAMITTTIIGLIERGIEIRTIAELTEAVSNILGVKVSTRSVKNALKRNRHRIIYDNGIFSLSICF